MRLMLARRSCSSSRSLCRRPPPTPSRSKGRGPAGGVEGTHVFIAQNGDTVFRAPTVRMARRFTPLRGYFTGTRCFSSSAQFTTT